MSEVAPDPCGQLCQPAHVADDGALEFVLAAGGRLAGHCLLQVGVQAFVRIELGIVGRQVPCCMDERVGNPSWIS
jgi:hypothetical protein